LSESIYDLNSASLIQVNDHCQPLPPPSGSVINVSTVTQLRDAVNNGVGGTTILIADGTYNLHGVYLRIDEPNLTIRSASGNREAVILDGNYQTTEIFQIVASNVTIADMTLQKAYDHPIHVMSSDASDTENTLIYNVHVIDPGQQAIKINPVSGGTYPDDGVIACSHIELTDAGRTQIRDDCYTGGIDAHQAEGWVIRDNLIEGFWCASGLSEHGIHLWRGCRDTLVERNVLVDNARGIGFGLAESGEARTYPDNPCPSANGGYVDHYGGIIRNNFVFANRTELFASPDGFDCGICLWQACGAQALHNTVVSTDSPFSSIEWRFSNTNVEIKNNLVSHNLRDRGGTSVVEGNLENTPLSVFVDGPGGDLHLIPSAAIAIDQVAPLPEVFDDIDGDARPIGPASDIGADEYGIPAPAAVHDLQVTDAITNATTLTATLQWTPPVDAVTTTLRYSSSLITIYNWSNASLLTDTYPGSAEMYSAVVPYTSGTAYFALKTHGGTEAGWSELSNNAFWPSQQIYLPVIRD
jgi:hypothetical protein